MEFLNNRNIQLQASADPGRPDLTIVKYEWKINNVVQQTTTDAVTISTAELPLGENSISVKVQNSCGAWSEEVLQNITIIEITGGQYMVQVPIVINQQTQSITITVSRKSKLTVTIMDDPAFTNAPLSNIPVECGGISGVTDANGKVTLTGVPAGNQIIEYMP